MMTIGLRIKIRRKELGLTQGALAKAIGVDRVAVTNWEKDGNGVNGKNLTELCRALKTTPDWILHGIEPVDSFNEAKKLAEEAGSFYVRLLELAQKLPPEKQKLLEDTARAFRSLDD